MIFTDASCAPQTIFVPSTCMLFIASSDIANVSIGLALKKGKQYSTEIYQKKQVP